MQKFDIKNIQLLIENDCGKRLQFSDRLVDKKIKTSKYIFAELKRYLGKYKTKEYEFVDCCNINLLELNKLCTLIIKDKLEMEWSAPAVLNPKMNYAILDKMKKAGCKKLIFDLFSGSDNLLEKMGAMFTSADASRILNICHQIGISTGINLLFGHPQETEGDFNNTIDFLVKNLSFINEITKVSYCLGNFFYSNFLELPLCSYWTFCLGSNKKDEPRFSIIDFTDCISKISSLLKPIVYTEPSKIIFDYLKKELVEQWMLRRDKLIFLFDKGKGRLFWKGIELTTGLGLYASIFIKGFWQDSEHANWQVIKIDEKKMVLKGEWWDLPIIQIWEIELKDENLISLKIEMEVVKQIVIEGEQQFNVMLRNNYNKWSANNGLFGFFPGLFNENWVTLFEEKINNITTIKTDSKNSKLPNVSLECTNDYDGYSIAVLNTSSSFRGRILKCYKINNSSYPPGKYFYFDGEIKLEN